MEGLMFATALAKRYPGLTVCYRCDGVYTPGNWVSGYYEPGTTGRFLANTKIPDEHCPTCRMPPLTTPPIACGSM